MAALCEPESLDERYDEAIPLTGNHILGIQVGGRACGAHRMSAFLHSGQIGWDINRTVVHVVGIIYGNGQRRDLACVF